MEALDPELQEMSLDFAVFPEETPIPEAAGQILWTSEGLDELDVEEMLDELESKSLLRRDDEGRLTLHDLQNDCGDTGATRVGCYLAVTCLQQFFHHCRPIGLVEILHY